MPRRVAPPLALFLRHSRRWLGILVLAALALGCNGAARVLSPRPSVADLLAHPPAAGQAVEVDAYFSGALGAPPASDRGQAAGSPNWHALLSDRPFLPELSLLGSALANALPGDAAWLVATASPGALALDQLPYYARFRGHFAQPSASGQGPTAGRVFVVERVVHTYARRPPAAPALATGYSNWRRYRDVKGAYSVPQPPGWHAQRAEDGSVALSTRQWEKYPITLRIYPGETHHDPYDPELTPPLLRGQKWSLFAQGAGQGPERVAEAGLSGYRVERAAPATEGHTAVLFSAHGKTYELSMRYALGFGASQAQLAAFSAVVAGFRLEAPPEPSPTPPVRQALGPGPFLGERDALGAACERLQQQIESATAQLVSEAEARRLAGRCAQFTGHLDGVWVLTVQTPLAARTHTMRVLLEAGTGRELCREEIDVRAVPQPTPTLPSPAEQASDVRWREAIGPGERWIEIILGEQAVIAWEGDKPVRRMLASTGTADAPTVTGRFRIYRKNLNMTMSGPGYSLPGVPHVMFFHESYSLHGAYWHSSFGTPMSHGCVNLSLGDAAWLFEWAAPHLPQGADSVDATVCNPGTLVVVR